VSIGSYILRRFGSGLFAVAGVSVLVFLFLHMTPGDPVDQLAGGDALPEQREAIEKCLNLDKSLPEQFGIFLRNVANGTLGHQCPNPENKPTVMDRVADAFPYTIELAIGGMVVALLFALPLGVIAAVRRGTWIDAMAAVVSLSGLSVHIAFMGPGLIIVFFVILGWLPGPAEPDAAFALLLPSIVIGTHLMALLARMTRSSLVDVLRADYMTTARAKGLPEWVVLLKHGLRNALLPVITVAGLQFGSMLAGAILTEKIFARPGLGTLLLEGISERNYPLVQGVVLVIATIYVLVNILVDVLYGVADPRVRRG
jgi:ABC-type dipeptide/oligopeptide/nickel transport system permease component